MQNYICINGNKTELTEEQLKQLGIELPKANPFKRAGKYYTIISWGEVVCHKDGYDDFDNACYNTGNYCTDKAILEQRALHETLNRLLWRYSMKRNGDKLNWDDVSQGKWYIYYEIEEERFGVETIGYCYCQGEIYFYSRIDAENAIEEIIKPFMAAHPEFKF